MPQCVTEYFSQEHQELSQLLNELQEELLVLPLARSAQVVFERLHGLFRKVSGVLHTHFEEEEVILYPVLEGHMQGITNTLERMRREHDAGEAAEKAFFQCVQRLAKIRNNRAEVMRSGLAYIHWVRSHLLSENGRLFPLVERSLDAETQKEVRRAMEELSRETTARIAESFPREAQA